MKTLIFDFGNVLCRIDFDRVLHAWSRGDAATFSRIKALYRHDEVYQRHEVGQVSIKDYKAHTCRELGLSLSLDEFIQGWNALFLEEIPLMRDLLLRLRGDYRLVLLSNTNSTHHEFFSARYAELLAPLDKLYFSHEWKLRKPDAAVFRAVLHDLAIEPDHAVFFDDLPENVAGAESVGIHSVLVTGYESVLAGLARHASPIKEFS